MRTFNLTGDNMYLGSNKVEVAYKGSELIFGNPPLVFPNPPQYYGSPTYAHFFGAGEENRYVGRQASLVTPGLTLQANGLIRSAGSSDNITLPDPSIDSHKLNGIYEFTIENNFDHLEPGKTSSLSYPTGYVQFSGTPWYLNQKKDVDGNTFITIGVGSSAVEVPVDDRAYIHIAVRYDARFSNRTARVYINGKLKHTVSRSSSASSTGIREVYIYPVVPVYDFKFYGNQTDETIITNNHNYISELKFIKTNQLQLKGEN